MIVSDDRLAELASDGWDGPGETPMPGDYAWPARGKTWTKAEMQAIEIRHGHDPRLKCYAEYGCRAVDYEIALIAGELLDLRKAKA